MKQGGRGWDNIKMDLKDVRYDDGGWMELAKDRVQWELRF
jgi:hypothetical protein